jgi:nucleotidyltransferase/DNA polymerase involved in DNA repair
MNTLTAENAVQWLFLDLNAFFASCEQQEAPALRGKPIIVVQTPAESAVAIAASYTAKAFSIASSHGPSATTWFLDWPYSRPLYIGD